MTPDALRELKKSVRTRDHHCCRRCGMSRTDHLARWRKGLEVHRIIPGSPYSLDGCITLCKSCHARSARSPRRQRQPLLGPDREYVGFPVPPGWTARVDAAVQALGLSRSAYIRLAVNRQLKRDQAEDKEGE